MTITEETEALAILAATPHLGAKRVGRLIELFGSAAAALAADGKALLGIKGFGPQICGHWGWWSRNDSWKRNSEAVLKGGVSLLPYTSPRYPPLLKMIADPPVILYVKGELPAESIALVGSREATASGIEKAAKAAGELVQEGVAVASGLARGIDTAAHRGALKRGGSTVAVLPSGLDKIYPPENKPLAEAIAVQGALVSEYPMEAAPEKGHFLQRNRIITGSSIAALLIESAAAGGALHAMQKAKEQGRSLYAFPGGAGNRALIAGGDAREAATGREVALRLKREEEEFFAFLPDESFTLEAISRSTKQPLAKLDLLLMRLILKKIVEEFPGKVYKKLARKELS